MAIHTTNRNSIFSPYLAAAVVAVAVLLALPVLGAHHGGEHADYEMNGAEEGAKNHHGRDGKFAKRRAKRMQKELGLSDEQVAELKEQREAGKAKLKPLYKALMENRKALREVQSADQYDENAVERLAAERAELTREMTIERSAQKHAMRSILTEDQLAKRKALKESHKAKKQHRKRGRSHREENPQEEL